MSNPINTLPLTQFIQQVKSAELSQQKEVKLDIKTAKIISFCLAEISLRLVQDYEALLSRSSNSTTDKISVEMDGGGFNNS